MKLNTYIESYQQLFGDLELVVPAWSKTEGVPAFRVDGSAFLFVEIGGFTFECQPLAANTYKIVGSNGFSAQVEIVGSYGRLLEFLRETAATAV